MKYALLTALLATVASPAPAQDIASDTDDTNDIVVTASRTGLDAREIGSSVTVITAEDLERGQITFVKDALQDLAGVRISTDRPGELTGTSIRGSDNDQVLFLIDGIELGDPSAITTQFSSEQLTTRDVARIEVLRGNQSSLYGSDAIGGVVNIITKRATADGFQVNAEAEAGSYDTLNGGASLLGRTGPVDFRVTATGYRHKGPSLADPATGPAVEDDDYSRYGFSGRVGLAASRNIDLQLIGFWSDSDSDLDGTNADSLDTLEKQEWAYAGSGSFRSDDGRFRAEAIASRYVARRRYFGEFNASEGAVFEGVKDSVSLNAGYDTGGALSVAAGGNYEEERTDQLTGFSGAFDARIRTRSAYAEAALKPLAGLTFTGAARIDDNSRFGSFDTYRATAAYVVEDAFGGSLKLRASYGTGAKAPGLYQLFDPTYGNPDLEVETSRGGDVGVDFSIGGRVTAQLSYFYARTRNEIVFDFTVPPFGGYGQFGRTRKSGVEVALAVRPADWLSIEQSYTFLDAEQDALEDGNWTDLGRPRHSGTTAVTLTPLERLAVTARARYRDRNASGFGGVTPGYEVVDLLGSYGITDTIEVFGRVVNLFDKQYQLSFGSNALDRSAYAGVRLSF